MSFEYASFARGEGNWASLNSVEADSRLLWRSSKLTEGRKSKELLGSAN